MAGRVFPSLSFSSAIFPLQSASFLTLFYLTGCGFMKIWTITSFSFTVQILFLIPFPVNAILLSLFSFSVYRQRLRHLFPFPLPSESLFLHSHYNYFPQAVKDSSRNGGITFLSLTRHFLPFFAKQERSFFSYFCFARKEHRRKNHQDVTSFFLLESWWCLLQPQIVNHFSFMFLLDSQSYSL